MSNPNHLYKRMLGARSNEIRGQRTDTRFLQGIGKHSHAYKGGGGSGPWGQPLETRPVCSAGLLLHPPTAHLWVFIVTLSIHEISDEGFVLVHLGEAHPAGGKDKDQVREASEGLWANLSGFS